MSLGDVRRQGLAGTLRATAVLLAAMLPFATGALLRAERQSPPMTEARLRALARQARRDAKGDPTELVLALDRRVRETWGDFESFPLSIVRRDDVLVTVSAPYMAFRRSIVDVLRSARPVDRATWTAAVVVSVTPLRLGAPDLDKVVVTRGGIGQSPMRTALRPMTFTNGNGDQGALHAGDVHFSPSAFAPGSTVVLTIESSSRQPPVAPIIYEFDDAELRTLR